MNAYRLVALLASFVALSGCMTQPNMVGLRGNGIDDRYSLQDRRAAKMHMKIVEAVPAGATVIGPISVERCHQYLQQDAPTEAVIADDLALAAYAQGADGITGMRFSRESALLRNCWFSVKGSATMFKAP